MKARVDLAGVGGDDHPLDQHVRALLHQLAVLERARLGLVGVADQVLLHVAVGQERDLAAHLEAGAAAAADARVHDLRQHVLGRHRQRLAQRLVAAAALVDLAACSAPARRCCRTGSFMSDLAFGGSDRGLRGASEFCAPGSTRAPVADLLVGQHGRPALQVLDDPAPRRRLQRADVLAVDRRHRRDVAGAQALERAHVDVSSLGGRCHHRLEQLVGAEQRARDVGAHVDVVVHGPAARSRACRRRSPPRSGTRASAAITPPPGRSPPASTSRARAWAACSAGIAAERRSGYLAIAASISARSSSGTGVVAGSGTAAGSLVRSTASSQPGTRDPWPKRGTGIAAGLYVERHSSVDASEDRVEHRQRGDQVGDVGVL